MTFRWPGEGQGFGPGRQNGQFLAAAILKMNFNFNFKDSLPAAEASIRGLTTACDFNHSAAFAR